MALLATSLPDGIMVKTFEDRMVSSGHTDLLTRSNEPESQSRLSRMLQLRGNRNHPTEIISFYRLESS